MAQEKRAWIWERLLGFGLLLLIFGVFAGRNVLLYEHRERTADRAAAKLDDLECRTVHRFGRSSEGGQNETVCQVDIEFIKRSGAVYRNRVRIPHELMNCVHTRVANVPGTYPVLLTPDDPAAFVFVRNRCSGPRWSSAIWVLGVGFLFITACHPR